MSCEKEKSKGSISDFKIKSTIGSCFISTVSNDRELNLDTVQTLTYEPISKHEIKMILDNADEDQFYYYGVLDDEEWTKFYELPKNENERFIIRFWH